MFFRVLLVVLIVNYSLFIQSLTLYAAYVVFILSRNKYIQSPAMGMPYAVCTFFQRKFCCCCCCYCHCCCCNKQWNLFVLHFISISSGIYSSLCLRCICILYTSHSINQIQTTLFIFMHNTLPVEIYCFILFSAVVAVFFIEFHESREFRGKNVKS